MKSRALSIIAAITCLNIYIAINPVNSATQPLFETFQQTCITNLHTSENGAENLENLGWSLKPITTFSTDSLLGNIFFHGLVEAKSFLYLSPDQKTVFIFGPSDNDITLNSKCLMSTKTRYNDSYTVWATQAFNGHKSESNKGKKYGNVKTEWITNDFPKNISAQKPYTAVSIHKDLNQSPHTDAHFQISVTGLTPE